jgi:hypothetical protein
LYPGVDYEGIFFSIGAIVYSGGDMTDTVFIYFLIPGFTFYAVCEIAMGGSYFFFPIFGIVLTYIVEDY